MKCVIFCMLRLVQVHGLDAMTINTISAVVGMHAALLCMNVMCASAIDFGLIMAVSLLQKQ